jgi:hypothetical protein
MKNEWPITIHNNVDELCKKVILSERIKSQGKCIIWLYLCKIQNWAKLNNVLLRKTYIGVKPPRTAGEGSL